MVMNRQGVNPLQAIAPLLTRAALVAMQEEVAATHISETVIHYIVQLVDATRHNKYILQGASPRATLCIASMSRAIAQLSGRDYVIPQDVRNVFLRCIPHRLLLTAQAATAGMDAAKILTQILDSVPAPQVR